MKMLRKTLEDIAEVIAGQSPPSSSYNSVGDGIPFFQGMADFNGKHPKIRFWCNKPTKISNPNDILISVRAPVGPVIINNVKACAGRGLGIIRVNKDISLDYVYYFLKVNEKKISDLGVGSTFKAITQKNLKKVEILIPEKLSDQIRIAEILSQAESLIAQRIQSISLLDELLKSTFLEMFGDPVKNEKGWEIVKLAELGKLDRGVSKHRPRNAPELLGGNYPLIQTGDISNAGLYISKFNNTYSEIGLKQSKLWPEGTLCITIAANIGKTSILGIPACFPDSVVGFVVNNEKANNIYVYFLFGFLQTILEKNAPSSAQKNINLELLRNLPVPKPNLKLQTKFANIVEKVEALKSQCQQSLAELQNMYGVLSQKAFKGEL